MNKIISLIALAATLALVTDNAAMASGGASTYGGTGATRGFVNGTGFVKERGNDDNHMDGKMDPAKSDNAEEGDQPTTDTDKDKNDTDGTKKTESK